MTFGMYHILGTVVFIRETFDIGSCMREAKSSFLPDDLTKIPHCGVYLGSRKHVIVGVVSIAICISQDALGVEIDR
jgi:hypothetical protein